MGWKRIKTDKAFRTAAKQEGTWQNKSVKNLKARNAINALGNTQARRATKG